MGFGYFGDIYVGRDPCGSSHLGHAGWRSYKTKRTTNHLLRDPLVTCKVVHVQAAAEFGIAGGVAQEAGMRKGSTGVVRACRFGLSMALRSWTYEERERRRFH